MTNQMYELLHATAVQDVAVERKNDLVRLTTNDNVEDAINTLAKNKILSAPVFDKDSKFIGFVDLADILTNVLKDVIAYTKSVADSNNIVHDNEKLLDTAGNGMKLVTLEKLSALKDVVNEQMVVYESDPVSRLVAVFANGLHRSLLHSKDKKITNLVSQTDIVRFLYNNLAKDGIKDMAKMTLKEFGYGVSKTASVKSHQNVLHALGHLTQENVRAIAVVDKDSGRLTGNFSASDLRSIVKERFPSFLKPVSEYLETYSPNSLKPVVVTQETTLGDVIKTLVESKIHHTWVIDERYEPIGVISMTDVLRIVANYNHS